MLSLMLTHKPQQTPLLLLVLDTRAQAQIAGDTSAWRSTLSPPPTGWHARSLGATAGMVSSLGTVGEAEPDPVLARVDALAAQMQIHPEVRGDNCSGALGRGTDLSRRHSSCPEPSEGHTIA
jgi:hypothetical protein